MPRARLAKPEPPLRQRLPREDEKSVKTGGAYDIDERDPTEYVRSGCTVLDCALGGGWYLGRVSSVYGDSATGKTLLAIEACANFARQYPGGKIFYRERESAFDPTYAGSIGLPEDVVDFHDYTSGLETIEDLYDDLTTKLDELSKSKVPAFYCVDSIDAFPDEGEVKADDLRETPAVAKKARALSQTFRLVTGRVQQTRMHLMFVHQIRTRIGVTQGRKTEMTGGTAIRFYGSQRLFLRQVETITPEVKGVKRPVGIRVAAKNEKSKVGMPYREVEFPILFAYGIDDLQASIDFLRDVGELGRIDIDSYKKGDDKAFVKETYALDETAYYARLRFISKTVRTVWDELEVETRRRHLPPRAKYA